MLPTSEQPEAWAEIVRAADMEDDGATVFNSRDACHLEWARCAGLYEPPPSSPRGKALQAAKDGQLWFLLKIPASLRIAHQRWPSAGEPPVSDAIALVRKNFLAARESLPAVQRIADNTVDNSVVELVGTIVAYVRDGVRVAESLEQFVRAEPAFAPARLSPEEEECSRSCAGFVRLVLRWCGDLITAGELTKDGMSGWWVSVAVATRLIPVVRGRTEFRNQQATWRKTLTREYDRLVVHEERIAHARSAARRQLR